MTALSAFCKTCRKESVFIGAVLKNILKYVRNYEVITLSRPPESTT
jgi:hypothetical protein